MLDCKMLSPAMKKYIRRKRLKIVLFTIFVCILFIRMDLFTRLFEDSFLTDFHYPYDGDIQPLIEQLRYNLTPDIRPINNKYEQYRFLKTCSQKCRSANDLRLVYVIKSAPENRQRRIVLRSTWAYEKRFSDVTVRTVFLLGRRPQHPNIQLDIDKESDKFQDIVQGDYIDAYMNNTLKTMMGFKWLMTYCPNSKFYMFVDDDYYVSTKNVLRFIRNPVNYPNYFVGNVLDLRNTPQLMDEQRLYAGYGFVSRPQRHWLNKWYVSLREYAYDRWPPYITAGAYILSHSTLEDMYLASFYTQHMRFDDIYVALLAYKTKIGPFHCENFHFYKQSYYPEAYKYTIASHGYGNPEELLTVWTEQRSLGYA